MARRAGDARREPVSLPRVGAAAGLVALALAGIVALSEWLRHPPPDGPGPVVEEPAADPRVPVDCPAPPPRADTGRDQPVVGPPGEVVTVSSNDLYDCPRSFDGRTVRYQGEAIGAAQRRAGGAWVQMNDDIYADLLGPLPAHRDFRGGNAGVGVLLPRSLADQIAVFGGPDTQGDLLEIVGVFHRVDPATREVAVIRAEGGEVVRPGRTVVPEPLTDRMVAAVLLGVGAAAAVVTERVVARRR